MAGKGLDDAVKRRQEESVASLRGGGLPLNAVDRLREQAGRQGKPGHLFTSDLSVNELALGSDFEPLGQVMGSTIYHLGWGYVMWSGYTQLGGASGAGGELQALTKAYYNARRLALGRLQKEAALLGATGVVGVRLERKAYEWGPDLLEFAAIGTAIRERDVRRNHENPEAVCVSALSGQEFWLLRQAGYRPAGFVLGNCTWYQVASAATQQIMSSGLLLGGARNVELRDFTQAVYEARSLAMGRMEAEAAAVNATGIVGADVHVEASRREGDRLPEGMVFHFTATGAAIRPFPRPKAGLEIMPALSTRA